MHMMQTLADSQTYQAAKNDLVDHLMEYVKATLKDALTVDVKELDISSFDMEALFSRIGI